MQEILIRELMSPNVVSIGPDAVLSEVIQNMLDKRHSCMVVVSGNLPIGIVTERDIVRLMAQFLTDRPQCPIRVAEVMSVPVATVTQETSLFEALVISSAQKIRHLPVVDDSGALMGLVTQSDLAKAHFHIFEKQRLIIEESVSERTRELQEANRQLKSLSMVDALTGLGNRRAMEVDLEHTHAQSTRYNRPYSIALFDVDHFKLYNDTYGHKAGDTALRRISEHLSAAIRKSDRLYRYGGEEILLLMPETTVYGALILADRILAGFAELNIPHEKSAYGYVTLSCGVACQMEQEGFGSWDELLDLADRGLYTSKERGRNQVTIIPPEDADDTAVPRMHKDLP